MFRSGSWMVTALSLSLGLGACVSSGAPVGESVGHATLTGASASGAEIDVAAIAGHAPLTVFTFFSAHCPCQRARDARLRQLHAAYAPRGVAFVAIDAEREASVERATREARARGYPFPILADPSGRSIDALGAEFATYTVIVDRRGTVRYSGGLDSDKSRLSTNATLFVRDALDDLLEGNEPRRPHGVTLGCALER